MRVRDRVSQEPNADPMAGNPGRILIGGVGYRWQRDMSFGLVVCDLLEGMDWPPGVEIADLGYGAIYAAQDLADAEPPYQRMILLAGVERGREPGQVAIYRWAGLPPGQDEIQERIREAGAGVIDLDHLLYIAQYFRALPDEVVLVESEPVDTRGGEGLSPEVDVHIPQVVELIRRLALGDRSLVWRDQHA